MAFTISRDLDRLPSYSLLSKLAEAKHVHVVGNESTGSFFCRGVEGDYQLGEDGLQGKFAGHGVTGAFTFEIGKAAVTIVDKPFWLPERLLKQKIAEGLDTFCTALG